MGRVMRDDGLMDFSFKKRNKICLFFLGKAFGKQDKVEHEKAEIIAKGLYPAPSIDAEGGAVFLGLFYK